MDVVVSDAAGSGCGKCRVGTRVGGLRGKSRRSSASYRPETPVLLPVRSLPSPVRGHVIPADIRSEVSQGRRKG
jgi:hypothetical protein